MLSICLAYLIFTFREFKSIHKGKTAILHLRFGTEKNRRLGSKKARYNRAFRRRHLFCLHIMARPKGFEPLIFRIGICCVIQLRHGRNYFILADTLYNNLSEFSTLCCTPLWFSMVVPFTARRDNCNVRPSGSPISFTPER